MIDSPNDLEINATTSGKKLCKWAKPTEIFFLTIKHLHEMCNLSSFVPVLVTCLSKMECKNAAAAAVFHVSVKI